ncbi:MAG: FecR domain-containing protein [Gammaproteobacteria bacterium]|nr:FecR domain-containing protein [Gammaproteobacteria bacterium]
MDMKNTFFRGLIIAGLLQFSFSAVAATQVGEVKFARGVLTGQVGNEAPRILGKGLPLHNGETLNTGSSGFAVINLEDGTRMTLRPNSSFKIVNVDARKGKENAFMRLFKGGFRAITGFISKRNPNAFRVGTSVATIGIRGTDFDARLCEGTECDDENKSTGEKAQKESRVIGRIAMLRGKGSAMGLDAKSRILTTGAAVYEQDQLQTGIKSFAVIAFNDKSRVTMSPGTAFKIEEHHYKPKVPDENNAFFRFLRGGLRFVTGAIGKLNKRSFRVATPTATIGIRGTGFDLACEDECVDNTAALNPLRDTTISKLMNYFLKPVYAVSGSGMYARVWSGAIEFQFQGGKLLLENGKAAFLKNGYSKPVIIPNFPVHLRKMGGAPRPDNVEIKEDLFSGADPQDMEPGLYVNVREGDVAVRGLDGKTINLGKGEASLSSLAGATVRLNFVPPFQKFDKVPAPNQVTPQMKEMLSPFGDQGLGKKKLECRLQ